MDYQVLIIDGQKFTDLNGFFDEVNTVLTDKGDQDKSFENLHQLLTKIKDEINEEAPVDLIWRHAQVSKQRLGTDTFQEILDVIQVHPNVNLLLD